jgi:predicted DNA-binding transcriptional regulator YafY
VSERAARRHVAILCEAGVPIESLTGRPGGYRLRQVATDRLW